MTQRRHVGVILSCRLDFFHSIGKLHMKAESLLENMLTLSLKINYYLTVKKLNNFRNILWKVLNLASMLTLLLTRHIKLTTLGWHLLFTHQIAFLYGNSAADYCGRFFLQHFFCFIKKMICRSDTVTSTNVRLLLW